MEEVLSTQSEFTIGWISVLIKIYKRIKWILVLQPQQTDFFFFFHFFSPDCLK